MGVEISWKGMWHTGEGMEEDERGEWVESRVGIKEGVDSPIAPRM